MVVEQNLWWSSDDAADDRERPMEAGVESAEDARGKVVGWEGTEELEIFAVVQGGVERNFAVAGDEKAVDGERDARCGGHAGCVESETVAEVHHGGGFGVADEPLRFGEAGREAEVAAAGEGTTERAGNGDEMAGASAGPRAQVVWCSVADHGDVEGHSRSANRIAADDSNVEGVSRAAEAVEECTRVGGRCAAREAEGNHSKCGHTAHGSDVTDINCQSLPGDSARRVRFGEMCARGECIAGEEKEVAGGWGSEDRSVVADTVENITVRARAGGEEACGEVEHGRFGERGALDFIPV